MSIHRQTPTSQKPTSTVEAGSGSRVLVPFGNRGHQLAKIGPAALRSEWSSAKAAMRPLPAATGESATGRPTPSAIVIDFARARRSGRAVPIPEASSHESRNRLTLADVALIVYVTIATGFYPALAWLLIRP